MDDVRVLLPSKEDSSLKLGRSRLLARILKMQVLSDNLKISSLIELLSYFKILVPTTYNSLFVSKITNFTSDMS